MQFPFGYLNLAAALETLYSLHLYLFDHYSRSVLNTASSLTQYVTGSYSFRSYQLLVLYVLLFV
jgi:hypothetical protein